MTGVRGESAGNKLLGRLRPESADQGEVIVGGGPLNKGVIQLLYAGIGRESRTISGPKAAAERNHEESAELTAGKNGSGPERDRGAVFVRV